MVSMSPAAPAALLPSHPQSSHLQLRPALLLAALVEVPGLFVELLGDEATGRHCNTQDFFDGNEIIQKDPPIIKQVKKSSKNGDLTQQKKIPNWWFKYFK